jgi:hypothetical protein
LVLALAGAAVTGSLAVGIPAARAQVVAVLQGLDKTSARIATIDAPVDKQVRYGNLLITARACVKNPPMEAPENSAFLEIDELPPDAGPNTKAAQIFSGWMFSSSPALSALENPVYDVSVLDCEDVPGPGSGAAAPSPTSTKPAKSGITAKPLP